MPNRIAIIAGADINDYSWLLSELSSCNHIICADSGLRHADAINITPDIIIGDFDSVSRNLLNIYEGKSEIIHDPDQYSTDLMKALTRADLYDNNAYISIYGAIGQRADHDFGNYLILLGQNNPERIILKSPSDERRIIKKTVEINVTIGDIVGVFPLTHLKTLEYEGLKWPAHGISGPYDLGWNGACNPATEEKIIIRLNGGAALITVSKDLNRI